MEVLLMGVFFLVFASNAVTYVIEEGYMQRAPFASIERQIARKLAAFAAVLGGMSGIGLGITLFAIGQVTLAAIIIAVSIFWLCGPIEDDDCGGALTTSDNI